MPTSWPTCWAACPPTPPDRTAAPGFQGEGWVGHASVGPPRRSNWPAACRSSWRRRCRQRRRAGSLRGGRSRARRRWRQGPAPDGRHRHRARPRAAGPGLHGRPGGACLRRPAPGDHRPGRRARSAVRHRPVPQRPARPRSGRRRCGERVQHPPPAALSRTQTDRENQRLGALVHVLRNALQPAVTAFAGLGADARVAITGTRAHLLAARVDLLQIKAYAPCGGPPRPTAAA